MINVYRYGFRINRYLLVVISMYMIVSRTEHNTEKLERINHYNKAFFFNSFPVTAEFSKLHWFAQVQHVQYQQYSKFKQWVGTVTQSMPQ